MDVTETPPIAVLSADLASQIAAGEVVERPASVVKELVENALDAGASRIEVSIEGGGLSRIAVRDDGRGMSHEDAPRSLLRHATSKLRALSDLEHIGSYGFRGEALPSIASVSRTRIVTRTAHEDAALALVAEGTTESTGAPLGAPVGTLVEVRELFFNVPARRKFLRSTSTESGHVTDVIEGLALGRPDVLFSLERDGRVVRSYLRARSREERAMAVLDDGELLAIRGARGPLSIEAFLAHPERARSGTQGLRLLVNGRVVRDRALAATIAHAYGDLERGQYPRGAVYLDLPGTLVDVNVHPQKTEVRFVDPRAVQGAVHGLLSPALARQSWPPARARSPASAPRFRTEGRVHEPATATPLALRDVHRPSEHTPSDGEHSELRRGDPPAARSSPAGRLGPALRVLGRLENSLVVVESGRGVLFVDPHALRERALHRELTLRLATGPLPSERLVFPLRFELDRAALALLEQRAEHLTLLGFDLRAVSEHAATLFSAPLPPFRPSESALRSLALALATQEPDESRAKAIAVLACTAAGPRALVPRETLEELLVDEDLDAPALGCAHERVIVQALSWSELAVEQPDERACGSAQSAGTDDE